MPHSAPELEPEPSPRQTTDAQAWLAAVVQSSTDAIVGTRLDGTIVSWNAAAARRFGWTADEMIGRPLVTVVPLELRDEVAHVVARILRGERLEPYDTVWLQKDGSRAAISLGTSAVRDASGAIVGLAMIARDVDEQQLLVEALHHQTVELERQTLDAQTLADELELTNRELVERDGEARQALARFEGIFNSRIVGLSVYDLAAGRTVAINDYLLDLIGYTREEFDRGAVDWQDVTPAEYLPAERRWIEQVIANGSGERFEKEYVRKDGTRVPVSVAGTAISGVPGQFAIFVQDLTERRRSEAALAEQERQFRVMVDAIPQLAWTARPDGFVDWYNERWFEYTGATPEDLVGWGWQAVHHPAELPRVMERWQASIATGEPFEMEFPLRGADGRFRWFLTRVLPLKSTDGRLLRWFGTNTDIDAMREARREADVARAIAEGAVTRVSRLQALTAALSGALTARDVAEALAAHAVPAVGAHTSQIGLLSPDAAVVELVNPTALPADIADAWRRFPASTPVPIADAARTGTRILLASHEEIQLRYPLVAPVTARLGGSSVAVFPLSFHGRTLGAVSFVFDAPRTFPDDELALMHAVAQQCAQAMERARLYEAERAARADAERAAQKAQTANRVKTEFLTTMSHELRTPLNAITGYVQLIEMGVAGAVTERQREYLARVRGSSDHLLGLINDILDLAKIDAGRLSVADEAAHTGAAIRAAIAIAAPQAAARGVRLDVEPEHDAGAEYVGDPDRVRQIVINLLSNAVKFTAPGGRIGVSTGIAPEAPSSARVEPRGPWGFIRVEDTGVGIAPEMQAAVFEPFVQGEAGTTRTHGGTGLGLAISRRLARLMGGDLTLESEPGVGSAFTVWLPTPAQEGAADGGDGSAGERRAVRDSGPHAARGLAALAVALRRDLDAIMDAWGARLRTDPLFTKTRALDAERCDDHMVAFLADLLQALVLVDRAGGLERELFAHATEIQEVIAALHGTQRRAAGFTEHQLAREYELLVEVLSARIHRTLPADLEDATLATGVLTRLVMRAHAAALSAFRGDGTARAGSP